MACLRKLKDDIAMLETLFPKEHERFRITSASVDEISAKFIDNGGKVISMTASIQENYPRQSAIWFSEDESTFVMSILERLTEQEDTILPHQIHMLVTDLCKLFDLEMPKELQAITPIAVVEDHEDDYDEHTSDAVFDDDMISDEPQLSPTGSTVPEAELSVMEQEVLAKVSKARQQEHLAGKVKGSVVASDRLMKEIRDIYRSDAYRNGVFTIELLDEDNLYEWYIKLFKVDPDSLLSKDLVQLTTATRQDFIKFHMVFNANFPFEPPFVRLVSPTIDGGFVTRAGAICLELLTKQGWSSAYSIESVILQIACSLVHGKGRIQFDPKHQSHYTVHGARASYSNLVQVHNERGWYTPAKEEG